MLTTATLSHTLPTYSYCLLFFLEVGLAPKRALLPGKYWSCTCRQVGRETRTCMLDEQMSQQLS